MTIKKWLELRWRALFRKSREEARLHDELQFHLECLIAQKMAAGMNREEARQAARREFGSVDLAKEECRDARALRFVQTLLRDLRYGARVLRRSPGFAVVAVLSLALGIGANTAIFSLIDAILLRLLPVKDPSRLVLLQESYDGQPSSFSYPSYEYFRGRNHVFSAVIALSGMNQPKVEFRGEDAAASVQMVSENFYDTLGVSALVGRTFAASDLREPVAVIGYRYWKRRFALDSRVVGKPLTVNGNQFTIIGVTPPEFFGAQVGRPLDIAIPLGLDAQVRGTQSWLAKPNYNWLFLMARLGPGVGIRQAQADASVLLRLSLAAAAPKAGRKAHRTIAIVPGGNGLSWLRREFSEPLAILMALVALVLLIACANIANLQLARAKAREHEIAVRMAVGAGRARVIRQLLTESALLAAGGAALGLPLARWATSLLVDLMSRGQTQISLTFHPDPRILAFTASLALLTVLLFGLAPARAATSTLRTRRTGARLGKALVAAQVAFSVLLLAGAGLFTRTLANLKNLDAGFDRRNLLMFPLNPGKAGYQGERTLRLYQDVLERMRALPGVRAASFSMMTPIWGGGITYPMSVEGRAARADEDATVYYNSVGPGFFETLGTPLLAGREFGAQDGPHAPPVAIINQSVARRYFPNVNPIGRRVSLGNQRVREIVGVVKDAKYMDLRAPEPPTVYVPLLQQAGSDVTIELRVAAAPAAMAGLVRGRLREIDPKLPVGPFRTLEDQVNESLVNERLMAAFSSGFGGLALVLASIGLYGIMAYAVVRRTNEIGIRMALGAPRGNVIWMVLRETLVLVAAGISAGVPAALACARLVSHRLYGLKPADPLTMAGAALLMACVAVLAAWLPARRASRVDPMMALRYE